MFVTVRRRYEARKIRDLQHRGRRNDIFHRLMAFLPFAALGMKSDRVDCM